jgi:hypothetical protein
MSKNKDNVQVTLEVLADLLEGKLTDYQIFLKHDIGIQTTIKLRALLKTYEKENLPTV